MHVCEGPQGSGVGTPDLVPARYQLRSASAPTSAASAVSRRRISAGRRQRQRSGVVAQQLGKVLRRLRPAEKVPLELVASVLGEKIELLLGLHAFGDHLQ